MTSHRFTRTIKRAGLLAGMSAALLLVVDSAAARPRASFLQQVEQEAEPLAPSQDRLAPAQRGGGVSLQQATAMAQMRYQGRVVRAETVQMGDRVVHEIRILGDDGRVRTVRIDAQTGAFL
ncbi:MAG TPA: PepSY domain-containing protein [Gammaproteobacteria bacterium]|nr:PepSY domain-containing protein [Gammaproteobacteria bacterium]